MSINPLRTLAAIACVSVSFAASAAGPKVVSYPASEAVSVELTLLKKAGKVGREQPFFNGYRPQFVFSGAKAGVTCAIQIPKPKERIEPGETAEASISCIEGFKVVEKQLRFTFWEGGRKVGDGTLRP